MTVNILNTKTRTLFKQLEQIIRTNNQLDRTEAVCLFLFVWQCNTRVCVRARVRVCWHAAPTWCLCVNLKWSGGAALNNIVRWHMCLTRATHAHTLTVAHQ